MIDTTHLIEKRCLENLIYLCATEYLIRDIQLLDTLHLFLSANLENVENLSKSKTALLLIFEVYLL